MVSSDSNNEGKMQNSKHYIDLPEEKTDMEAKLPIPRSNHTHTNI